MTLGEWRGQPLSIKLISSGDAQLLEIALRCQDALAECEFYPTEARKLHKAACISLDLDATLAKLVSQGETVRLEIRPVRPKPPSRPRNVDEAIALRPQIEELIAPLIIETASKAVLRPFQELGVRWLTEQNTAILADDMGLGKTAQALRASEALIAQGVIRYALVVCPKSLLANWEAECAMWVPGLTVMCAVPPKDESQEVWSAILGRAHIIITSYEQLRTLPKALASTTLELVIADEAHRLRKSQAKIVKAFRLLNSGRIWALTGTPIERDEEDLATLLSVLEPTRFKAKPTVAELAGLRDQARPYILRRLKTDVLSELPEVIDAKEIVDLTAQQQRAYSATRSQPLSKDVGEILQRLTILRSICDMDPKSGASSKLDRITEILKAVQDAGEKAIVFSYLLQPLRMLQKRLSQEHPSLEALTLTGNLTTAERGNVLQEFKSDKRIVALLCSSRVGGEGLTLTEANHVIFINEWWNPSANAQARDRVVRFGQKRIVHIHRFRCRGTVEQALDDILNRKSEAFANVVDALASGAQLTISETSDLIGEVLGQLEIGPESPGWEEGFRQ